MPPPQIDDAQLQAQLGPLSSSHRPHSPSLVANSHIMPDRQAFDDDSVTAHAPVHKSRQRSKTQPFITFTLAADSALAASPPPSDAAAASASSHAHHHPKSKSQYSAAQSPLPLQPVTPRRVRPAAPAAAAPPSAASVFSLPRWSPSAPANKHHECREEYCAEKERQLTGYEKKRRMDSYERGRREEGARRAREKAERAMGAVRLIRESMQGGAAAGQHKHRRAAAVNPAGGSRQRERAEGGGYSVSVQTEAAGWELKAIEQRLVAMLSHARHRLHTEINELEEEIISDKENREGQQQQQQQQGRRKRSSAEAAAPEAEGVAAEQEDEETEEEKTARLTFLHSHLLVCEKLEKQVLDCLDSTFALLQAYGGVERTGTEQAEGSTAGEGEDGRQRGRSKKQKMGKRMSKFERLLLEEKEKDLWRIRKQQEDSMRRPQGAPAADDDRKQGAFHSASSLSAVSSSLSSSANSASSQSFTFASRPSFHTLEVSDRLSHQPATALLHRDDEHQIIIPSPSPALSASPATLSPQPLSLVTHDPSSSIITFPLSSGSTPPEPRRLSLSEKHQLLTTSPSSGAAQVITYRTITEEKQERGTLAGGPRRWFGGGGRHAQQPSFVAAPVSYSLMQPSFHTPHHRSHASNFSSDLKVLNISRTASLLPSTAQRAAQRDDELHRTPASSSSQHAATATAKQAVESKEGFVLPSSIHQQMQALQPAVSTASPLSILSSPGDSPQPSAPPPPYSPSCAPPSPSSLYRLHRLPAFLSHQHELLLSKLQLYHSELTRASELLSVSACQQQSIEQQWDAVCTELATRGCRVTKYHTRDRKACAVRWLQLSRNGLSMEWSSRKGAGPCSSLLLASIGHIRLGDECEFAARAKEKGGRAAGVSGWARGDVAGRSGGGAAGGRKEEFDVGCCVSFVGLKRSLDVVFEHRMELQLWLWICRRAAADNGSA